MATRRGWRATPLEAGAAVGPIDYRTSTRAREETDEVIAFVKRSYAGEDLSRSQVIARIATASVLLAIGIPARAYALDIVCALVIVSSIPAVHHGITRRRLRSAGLHAELAVYEASLKTG